MASLYPRGAHRIRQAVCDLRRRRRQDDDDLTTHSMASNEQATSALAECVRACHGSIEDDLRDEQAEALQQEIS